MLHEIVRVRPCTLQQLQAIKGMGPAKVQAFGSSILQVCNATSQSAASSNTPVGAAPTAESTPGRVAKATPELIQVESLNAGQHEGAQAVLGGQSIFLTGAAGTGKSYLLRYLIQELSKKHSKQQVAVTASTGIAASHIHGVTIHSFSGIGLGTADLQTLLSKVQNNSGARGRWRSSQVLVIDEISMLNNKLFDILEGIARAVRKNPRSFGAIQLILCGDFFQLPPVGLGNYGSKFAFESNSWASSDVRTVQLTEVVRQAGDLPFIRLLNQVRRGLCTEESASLLSSCHVSVKEAPTDGIIPTRIYCKNVNVDNENAKRLALIPTEQTDFACVDTFESDEVEKGKPASQVAKQLTANMEKKSAAELALKIGAQVMLTKNDPAHGLVNGSRGVLVGFVTGVDAITSVETMFPRVRFDNGVNLTVRPRSFFQGGQGWMLVRKQLPLKLAWALTVHKSQGMTLTRAELMLEDAFDYGQVYVALSRVSSLEGLWIRGGAITQAVVKAHPAVIAFHDKH